MSGICTARQQVDQKPLQVRMWWDCKRTDMLFLSGWWNWGITRTSWWLRNYITWVRIAKLYSWDIFPSIMFLLINWEFHTMYPDYAHFPFLPGPPSHPCNLPKNRMKKKYTKFNLWSLYIHWSMDKLLVASPLKTTKSFLTPTSLTPPPPPPSPEAVNGKELPLQYLHQFLRTLFSSFLSGLFLSAHVRRDHYRILQCLSFSIMSMQPSLPLQKKLPRP